MLPTKFVHLDVDTGVDDALAILLALNLPDVRLVGISTVAGNTSARQAAINTAYLLDRLGAQIPLYLGHEQTCDGKPVHPVPSVHGEDGLGGLTKNLPENVECASLDSPGALIRAAKQFTQNLDLVLTGPVTNLALALSIDPDAIRSIGQITIMGGSINEGGNVTPYAEFNAYSDPKAMDIVMTSGLPIRLIPLDVTHRVCLATSDLGRRPAPTNTTNFLRDLTAIYRQFHLTTNRFDGCYLHDPLTVLAVVAPHLFTFQKLKIRTVLEGPEIGRTIAEPATTGGVEVAMKVDAEACLDLFWQTIARAKIVE